MAANKTFRTGPVAFATSSAGILSPVVTSMAGTVGLGTLGQPYCIIRHIRIVNTAGSAGTFTLSIGTTSGAAITAANTVIGSALSIAANSAFDWYGMLRLDGSTPDYLNGLASATSLTIDIEGEIGISG